MKKIFISLLLLCGVFTSKAQQSFLFKIKFLPDHLYESATKNSMSMEMNITGDSSAMAKLINKGVKLPMNITTERNMIFSVKTGSLQKDKNYSIILNFKDYTSKKTVNGIVSNGETNPLVGQHIYGKYDGDGKMDLDSISGNLLNDQLKEAILSSIKGLINQMHFPDAPLKIGDTFTQQVPFNLPLAGLNIQATIKIIYKLTAVENKLAYFDMDESMGMNMFQGQNEVMMTFKGSGQGMGKLVYDIDNNFAPIRNANLKMDYEILTKTLTITGIANILSTTQTTISALKQ